ncbi:MAG: efflux RND transporter permease subunit, partial [Leptospira sp.]|nr:efflux RND transporter permease subunit [Leptospira sp.]
MVSETFSQRKGDSGTHRARIRVVLQDNRKLTTSELISVMRKKMLFSEKTEILFEESGDVISSLLSPDSGKVNLEILGEDLSILSDLGEKIKKDLSQIKGVTDIKASLEDKSTEYTLQIETFKSAISNISKDYLASYLKIANRGSLITKIKLREKDTDVRLKFREQDIDSIDKVLRMKVKSPAGDYIQLSQIAKIETRSTQTAILRRGNSRVNLVSADLEPSALSNANSEIEKLIQKRKLPEGYRIVFSGDKENLDKSFGELSFALILAGVLIYMLIAGQFESLKFSFVMVMTIPLIFIGTFPALFLFNKSLNVSSFMGIVLLLGVVVDNATLYYEYVELILKEKVSLKKAIVDSGKIVLRPILMNNSTTVVGLLPIMFEIGSGTEFQSPMAVTVVSGLIASVFFSLYLIPVLFYFMLKNSEVSSVPDSKNESGPTPIKPPLDGL